MQEGSSVALFRSQDLTVECSCIHLVRAWFLQKYYLKCCLEAVFRLRTDVTMFETACNDRLLNSRFSMQLNDQMS